MRKRKMFAKVFRTRGGMFCAIALVAAVGFFMAALPGCNNGTTNGSTSGGNTPGGSIPGDNTDFFSGTFSAYVSTSLSEEYAYELAFETEDSSGRAAVLTPKDGGNYSLIAYGVSDGKVKGVSEGKINKGSGKLTLKPNDSNDPDITVEISGDEMTEISGETKKVGKHTMPGKVKPFKQTEGTSGDFKYATNPGNTVTITGYTGSGGDVAIPAQINGRTVIGIGINAFSCFYDYYSRNKFSSITIPDGVTSIGSGAFNSTGLTGITIPDSVISIGQGAFYNCKNLIEITIPDSVISIGRVAFSGCENLTEVTIAENVTSIGEEAFSGCINLTTVSFAPAGNLTCIEYGTFYGCRSLVKINIPDSVTSIGKLAFSDCRSLTNITIPQSVTGIGVGAFDSSGLTNIIIPDGITVIESSTFHQCRNLISITIPSSVTSIGGGRFLPMRQPYKRNHTRRRHEY